MRAFLATSVLVGVAVVTAPSDAQTPAKGSATAPAKLPRPATATPRAGPTVPATAEEPERLPPPAPVPARGEGGPLRTELERLRRDVQALQAERKTLETAVEGMARQAERDGGQDALEATQLRLRIDTLVRELGRRPPPRPPEPEEPPTEVAPRPRPDRPAPKKAEEVPPTAPPALPKGAVDPVALAHALYATGDYEGALKAYRLVNLTGLRAEERAPLQFMIATCLRKLGKLDEAMPLYREVASSRGDETMAEVAQWQLGALQWMQETQTQIREMRQRRLALEKKP